MGNHKSMSFTSENGIEATVLGSENMSIETKTMLSKVVEKAYLIDSNPEREKLPCHACQGGGCPVCSGFGYYYAG